MEKSKNKIINKNIHCLHLSINFIVFKYNVYNYNNRNLSITR